MRHVIEVNIKKTKQKRLQFILAGYSTHCDNAKKDPVELNVQSTVSAHAPKVLKALNLLSKMLIIF